MGRCTRLACTPSSSRCSGVSRSSVRRRSAPALDRTFHHADRDVDVDAEPVRSDALRLRLKALRRYESYLISFKTAAKLMRRR